MNIEFNTKIEKAQATVTLSMEEVIMLYALCGHCTPDFVKGAIKEIDNFWAVNPELKPGVSGSADNLSMSLYCGFRDLAEKMAYEIR